MSMESIDLGSPNDEITELDDDEFITITKDDLDKLAETVPEDVLANLTQYCNNKVMGASFTPKKVMEESYSPEEHLSLNVNRFLNSSLSAGDILPESPSKLHKFDHVRMTPDMQKCARFIIRNAKKSTADVVKPGLNYIMLLNQENPHFIECNLGAVNQYVLNGLRSVQSAISRLALSVLQSLLQQQEDNFDPFLPAYFTILLTRLSLKQQFLVGESMTVISQMQSSIDPSVYLNQMSNSLKSVSNPAYRLNYLRCIHSLLSEVQQTIDCYTPGFFELLLMFADDRTQDILTILHAINGTLVDLYGEDTFEVVLNGKLQPAAVQKYWEMMERPTISTPSLLRTKGQSTPSSTKKTTTKKSPTKVSSPKESPTKTSKPKESPTKTSKPKESPTKTSKPKESPTKTRKPKESSTKAETTTSENSTAKTTTPLPTDKPTVIRKNRKPDSSTISETEQVNNQINIVLDETNQPGTQKLSPNPADENFTNEAELEQSEETETLETRPPQSEPNEPEEIPQNVISTQETELDQSLEEKPQDKIISPTEPKFEETTPEPELNQSSPNEVKSEEATPPEPEQNQSSPNEVESEEATPSEPEQNQSLLNEVKSEEAMEQNQSLEDKPQERTIPSPEPTSEEIEPKESEQEQSLKPDTPQEETRTKENEVNPASTNEENLGENNKDTTTRSPPLLTPHTDSESVGDSPRPRSKHRHSSKHKKESSSLRVQQLLASQQATLESMNQLLDK